MRMKDVNRYLRGLLITSVVLSVMLVAGVPMIVTGAVYQVYAVMGIGIAFTVAGFYGCPIAWTAYGNNLPLKRVVAAVVLENLYTVQEISAQLGCSESVVRKHLDKAFAKEMLKGFKRADADTIILNENQPAGKKKMVAECPNCGAKFVYTADNARCPYCKSPVTKR